MCHKPQSITGRTCGKHRTHKQHHSLTFGQLVHNRRQVMLTFPGQGSTRVPSPEEDTDGGVCKGWWWCIGERKAASLTWSARGQQHKNLSLCCLRWTSFVFYFFICFLSAIFTFSPPQSYLISLGNSTGNVRKFPLFMFKVSHFCISFSFYFHLFLIPILTFPLPLPFPNSLVSQFACNKTTKTLTSGSCA